MNGPRCRKGFSLVEILISIILVGLSITALVIASNSFTQANAAGADISTAEFLVEQIRERTAMMSFADIAALGDQEYPTPIDAHGNLLTALATFSQQVVVAYVNRTDFSTIEVSPTDFLRVTVTVAMNGRPISSASWIRARY
jgi:prepilin-type N-terminal cleavage/methylation domain-containing protein